MPQTLSSPAHAWLPKPLMAIREGRIFCREAGGGIAYLGIVAMPRQVQSETLRAARMNTGLWVDAQHAVDLAQRVPHLSSENIQEFAANDLLTSLKFAQGALPDALELFVRRTFIEHEDPAMSWLLLLGASARRLPALPKDGLYEIGSEALNLIDECVYAGMNLGQVFREPLWGPKGQYGIGTSMEPGFYQAWIKEERARNARSDPGFAAYLAAMASCEPMPLAYTRAQWLERKQQSIEVVLQRLKAELEGEEPAPVQAPGQRP